MRIAGELAPQGFRVSGLQGLGFRVSVEGLGFRVKGVGFRV